jgi:phosphatidate cytidylyltransferase
MMPGTVGTVGTDGMLLIFAAVLALGGIAVHATRRSELIRTWRGWLLCAAALGTGMALGRPGAAVLAALLGLVAATEYARLQRLPAADALLLEACAAGLPVGAWLAPHVLWRLVLGAAALLTLVPVLAADAAAGGRRAAHNVFGLLWLAPLTGFVLAGRTVLPLCFAVALADVGGWCGGRLLGGPRLSGLSPAKRWGGVLGAAACGLAALAGTGSLSPVTALAVVAAAPLGDLLESMLKRGAGVKDAGAWLPGFGGLLDRIDSLLLALAVVVIL